MIRETDLYAVEEELAWRQADGSDKFVDIAATGARVRVLIECKKTNQDKLIFLQPEAAPQLGQDVWGIFFRQIPDSTQRGAVAYGLISTPVVSYKSMYCVAKSSNSNRLLEAEV